MKAQLDAAKNQVAKIKATQGRFDVAFAELEAFSAECRGRALAISEAFKAGEIDWDEYSRQHDKLLAYQKRKGALLERACLGH